MKIKAEIEFVILLDDSDQIGDAMSEVIFEVEFPDMNALVKQVTLIDWEVIEEHESKLRLER